MGVARYATVLDGQSLFWGGHYAIFGVARYAIIGSGWSGPWTGPTCPTRPPVHPVLRQSRPVPARPARPPARRRRVRRSVPSAGLSGLCLPVRPLRFGPGRCCVRGFVVAVGLGDLFLGGGTSQIMVTPLPLRGLSGPSAGPSSSPSAGPSRSPARPARSGPSGPSAGSSPAHSPVRPVRRPVRAVRDRPPVSFGPGRCCVKGFVVAVGLWDLFLGGGTSQIMVTPLPPRGLSGPSAGPSSGPSAGPSRSPARPARSGPSAGPSIGPSRSPARPIRSGPSARSVSVPSVVVLAVLLFRLILGSYSWVGGTSPLLVTPLPPVDSSTIHVGFFIVMRCGVLRVDDCLVL